ncbi:unnamed protein product [Camellia sinensis]
MKADSHSNQTQRVAFAGLLVLLLPIFSPNLFDPLGRASPSMFSSDRQQSELWSPLANQGWKPCIDSTNIPSLPKKSQGYIQVFLDGGLNQQRMGVFAVAKILNATLVIPHFEVNPVWKDSSPFTEIFDVDHFINVLDDEVSIVKELPSKYSWSTREYYGTGIRATRIKTAPVHASANWYLENVLPVLQRSLSCPSEVHPSIAVLQSIGVDQRTHGYGIAAIAPFSHRLAFDDLSSDIQHLRCKVNFQALVFVPHIKLLGDILINRLRNPSKSRVGGANYLEKRLDVIDKQGAGKFVVLHLRFDKDMASHSACEFGGGKAERLALAKYRKVIWQGRVLNAQYTDEELRNQGRCPLTPEEIGLLLAALGFNNNTSLYLASHKVYGGEARISTLRKLFPLMEDKKSLTTTEERSKVEGKASLLAAVDYYVSMQSDIFISASPGNMHNAMLGYRAYKNLKTIRPNMVLLGKVFLNNSIEWPEFQRLVQGGHKTRQGQIRVDPFPFQEAANSLSSAFVHGVISSSIGSVRFDPSNATPRTMLSSKAGLATEGDAAGLALSCFPCEMNGVSVFTLLGSWEIRGGLSTEITFFAPSGAVFFKFCFSESWTGPTDPGFGVLESVVDAAETLPLSSILVSSRIVVDLPLTSVFESDVEAAST